MRRCATASLRSSGGRRSYSCSAWSLLWCAKRIAAHQIQLGLGGGLAALIAVVAAAGALFAIVAWGALSDPKSRLGSWVQEKKADALFYGCGDALIQFGFFLILWGGSYSIYIGVAAFLCWVLLLVLFFRPGLKRDIETLDDPNDNPRANRLIGKRREPGSYDYPN